MNTWVQEVIAKISSTSDGVSNLIPTPPIGGPSSLIPISINTETFPGTPAVRLIGDCHFLQRLCQLLFFCFFFQRSQLALYMSGLQRTAETSLVRSDDIQTGQAGQIDPGHIRLGTGNAGQGYSFEEV